MAIVCGCYSGDGGGKNGTGLVRFGGGNATAGSGLDSDSKEGREDTSRRIEKKGKRFGTGVVPVSGMFIFSWMLCAVLLNIDIIHLN